MYASTFPGLSPRDLLGGAWQPAPPFPMGAPRQLRYYRARNAIYHLIRALRLGRDDVVLAPDYHHGNEISAIRAAGASVRFYPIDRRLQPDLDAVRALCREGAKLILVIHYLGWPQPIEPFLAVAREHGALVVEDCALALLSESGGRPLGSFGDWSVFCLYKTLPVPNGAILAANRDGDAIRPWVAGEPCGFPSIAGRTAELLSDWLRVRSPNVGGAAMALKGQLGRLLTRMRVERYPTGETGFDLDAVDLRMSPLSGRLLRRFDYAAVRRRRRESFLRLRDRLAGRVSLLLDELPEGVCPLFFPVLVPDKEEAVRALREQGVAALAFWNDGDREARREGSDSAFLRRHVLELPLHQGLSPEHIDFVAAAVVRSRIAGPLSVPARSANHRRSGACAGADVDARPALVSNAKR